MEHKFFFIKFLKKLGLKIKQQREYNHYSIQELSKITKIRTEYLKKIENGTAYGILIEKHLIKIAKALKIKVSELLDFK